MDELQLTQEQWQDRALEAEARLKLIEKALGHLWRKGDWDDDFVAVEDFGYALSVTFEQGDRLKSLLYRADDVRQPPRNILKQAAIRAASEFEGPEIEQWPHLHRLLLDELAEMARQNGQSRDFTRRILPLMITELVRESE